MSVKNNRLLILICLLTIYAIWSSTYLAMKYAIADIPPVLMSGTRYTIAGLVMYLIMKYQGVPTPTRQEWRGAGIVGLFLILGGNALVAWAETWTGTGVASINIAIIPVLTCLFSVFLGERRFLTEWVGVLIGFTGIIILNTSSEMTAVFPGNILLMLASLFWAFGSIVSRHIAVPKGLMASALQMLLGGLGASVFGLLLGERITHVPSVLAGVSYLYLIVFGSIIGFSAFTYLIKNTSPALATSYSFVNPIIAVFLGVMFAGEKFTSNVAAALVFVVLGVCFVLLGRKK